MILSFLLLVTVVGTLWVLCGLGPYLWLRSVVPHRGLASLGLCAGFGVALLGGVATQVFYLEIAPVWAIASALGLSLLLAAVAMRVRRESLRRVLAGLGQGISEDRDFGVAGLIMAVILFLPGYQGSFGQPYRIGIDQVGYAITTQYLLDGGTPSALRQEIVRQTGQPGEAMALNAHITALNFNTGIAAEFLLKAHRFGYPTYVAGVGQLLGLGRIVDYQFCLLAVPWGCALLLLLWFFRDVVRLPDLVAKAVAVAVAINPNQVNTLFEGQHAQIIVFPLLVLFFGGLYLSRLDPGPEGGAGRGGLVALIALVGAGIFSLYSDAFIALGVVGGGLWLADLLGRDWPALRRTTLFGLAVVLGLLVLNRYAFEWVGFIPRHLANLGGGNGGWPQPHWASPAGIVGYFSMYRGELGNLVARSGGVFWLEALVVAAMAAILALGGYRAWRGDREARFWLVPALVCAWVYVDLRWLKGFHNYGFMKVYTLLLLPLAGLHWTSLQAGATRSRWGARGGVSRAWMDRAVAGTAAVVIAMGLIDTVHFTRTSERLPGEVGQALQQLDRELDLSRYAILTSPEGGVGIATLAGYASFNWLNVSWSDKYLEVHRDKPVLVVVFDVSQRFYANAIRSRQVLYRGEEFVIIQTDRRVGELGLPESRLVADKATTSLKLTHEQAPRLTLFLRRELGFDPRKPAP